MRLRVTRLFRRWVAKGRAVAGSFGSGPVFIFSVHRSGGTLLMRLLNCHPDLVIWGEHGGILNRLAEISEIVALHKSLNPLDDDRGALERFVRDGAGAESFAPWAGPLDQLSFQQQARQFVTALFSRGLAPGQRWGFKEIRYYRPELAGFLLDLFPNAQFILLRRDLVEAAISNILTSWSLEFIAARQPELDAAAAHKIIEDVAYGLIAFEHQFAAIARKYPRRVMQLDYASLRDHGEATIARIAAYLRLPESPEIAAAWRENLAVELGVTNKAAAGGVLNRLFIEAHLAAVLPALRAEFAVAGMRPLTARFSQRDRPYAALLGDHTVNDGSHSTMF